MRAAPFAGLLLLTAFGLLYAIVQPYSAPGPPFADFGAYYAAGSVWSTGGDPFSTAVGAIEHLLPNASRSTAAIMPYVGPALGLPLWSAFARMPYLLAATLWCLVCVACALVVLAVPAVLAERRLRPRDWLALVLLGAAGPLVYGIGLGQAALPAVAAVALAIVCAQRRRWAAAAALAFVAAAFKPNIALVLLASMRTVGAFVAYAAAALAAFVGNLGIGSGLGGLRTYLTTVAGQSDAERFYAFQFTPTAIAFGYGVPEASAAAVGGAVSFAALAALVIAIRWSRASAAEGTLIACAAWPLIVPFVHQPDLAIVLLPGLYAVYRTRGNTWIAGALGVAIVSVNALALAQGRIGGLFAIVSATVVALQVAVLGAQAGGCRRLVPLIAVAAFALLAIIAPPTPLPMWPDSLPAGFVTALDVPAHVVWQRELVASHLEVPLPWVAFFRTLALGACVAIGVATTRAVRAAH